MPNSVKEMKNGWRGSVDNVEVSFRVNGLGLVRIRASRYYRLARFFKVIFQEGPFWSAMNPTFTLDMPSNSALSIE